MTPAHLIAGRYPHRYYQLFDELVFGLLRGRGLDRPGRRILDVGCGAGRHLARLGPGAVGIEYGRPALPPGGPPVMRADGRALPFRDRRFDTVLNLEVIEHIRDDRALLAELFRVTRPGGTLLLTTSPVLGTPMALLIPLKNRLHPHHAKEHINLQAPPGLLAKMRGAGFAIEQVVHWNVLSLVHYLSLFGCDRLATGWERLGRRLAHPRVCNNILVLARRPDRS